MSGVEDRAYWGDLAGRLGGKLVPARAAVDLRRTRPVAQRPGVTGREKCSHLEAFARLLYGLAPWLELEAVLEPQETALRERFRSLALGALAQGLNPRSPDRLNFSDGEGVNGQPLVDA